MVIGDFDSLSGYPIREPAVDASHAGSQGRAVHVPAASPLGAVTGSAVDVVGVSVPVIRLNCEKNETDTFAAAQEGLKRGYTLFHVYGGTGGRFEHTFANIQLLAFLSQNHARGYLFDKDCVMAAITDDCLYFDRQQSGYVSVFSLSERSDGVFLKGLKYELDNATVTNVFPIGVSNEFIGVESEIRVARGTILVVW